MSDLPPAVASWLDQIERLSERVSPCRYLLPAKWAAMDTIAMAFIDPFDAEAHQLCWTEQQLFGVHPEHGFLRMEYAGALVINDRPVIAFKPARIGFDRFSSYRTKPQAGLGAVGRGIRSPRPLMSRVAYWLGSYAGEIGRSPAP